MILVDKPYVSEFLKNTIHRNSFQVIKTPIAALLCADIAECLISETEAAQQIESNPNQKLYITSENAIGWISENLKSGDLPDKINLFKDKGRFRSLLAGMYPEYAFEEIPFMLLNENTYKTFPLPFIIKPSVGFFSMGVHRVTNKKEWEKARIAIKTETQEKRGLYPNEVLDTRKFILEACIEGTEYAIDAYYNSQGEPVVLNILKHVFSSEDDVSDRVYLTSKEVVQENLARFSTFLQQVGALADLRNFPVHVEVRVDDNGTLMPIEVNPMRFGGWCTTPDLTHFAYGFNPYQYYFDEQKPDWDTILKDKGDEIYSIVVLDNSTGVAAEDIISFDYRRLLTHFRKPLDLRKINFKEYPVFGFVFVETRPTEFGEIEAILRSDLSEFITT